MASHSLKLPKWMKHASAYVINLPLLSQYKTIKITSHSHLSTHKIWIVVCLRSHLWRAYPSAPNMVYTIHSNHQRGLHYHFLSFLLQWEALLLEKQEKRIKKTNWIVQVSDAWRRIYEGSSNAFPAKGNILKKKKRRVPFFLFFSGSHECRQFLCAVILPIVCIFRFWSSSVGWYKESLRRATNRLLVKFMLLENF